VLQACCSPPSGAYTPLRTAEEDLVRLTSNRKFAAVSHTKKTTLELT
jgi:hypothetical protein